MTFRAILDRGDAPDVPVTVEAIVMPYTEAVDVPQEYAHRFQGRKHVRIDNVTDENGTRIPLTEADIELIREMAIEESKGGGWRADLD